MGLDMFTESWKLMRYIQSFIVNSIKELFVSVEIDIFTSTITCSNFRYLLEYILLESLSHSKTNYIASISSHKDIV